MSETKVTEVVVYSPLDPTEEESEMGIIKYDPQGDLSEKELIDKAIEDPEERSRLDKNKGNISVTMVPGNDYLGQVSINVQFEGKRGLYDLCLDNQGELCVSVSGWLAELLEEIGTDFDVRIEAKPCQKTGKRLPLKRMAEILKRTTREVQQKLGPAIRGEHRIQTNITDNEPK